jgi:L-threonate 2-dehydrogenase
MTNKVGFVGLGSMGLPMAKQLLAKGFTVYGFDVAKAALDAFAEAGGRASGNPEAVADRVSLLLLVVATAEQAEAALFGPKGGAALLGEGGVVVLHSTVPPPFTKDLGARLAEMGLASARCADQRRSGRGRGGALSVMASGSPAAFDAAGPALDAMAKTVYRLGDEPGIGSTVKMINQHLAGVHIAAACEAMALGHGLRGRSRQALRGDLELGRQFLDVHQPGAAHPGPRLHPALGGRDLRQGSRDRARDRQGPAVPLPIAAAAHQQYLAAAGAGFDREDDSAVVKVYERLVGIEVKGGKGKA